MPYYYTSEIPDSTLLKHLQNASENAFEAIYNRYWDQLYIHAYKLLSDKDMAKDVVQEVFVALWKRSREIDILSLSSYLYMSTRNKVLNAIEKNSVYTSHLELLNDFISGQGDYPLDYLQEKELRQIIIRESENLPHKMRKVFELSRESALSQREIALKLNISERTVKKQIGNALKILRLRISSFYNFF